MDAAADAGADPVKFQTFQSDALSLADAPQATYQRGLPEMAWRRRICRSRRLRESAALLGFRRPSLSRSAGRASYLSPIIWRVLKQIRARPEDREAGRSTLSPALTVVGALRNRGAVLGLIALILTNALVIALPPAWITIALAGLATILLSLDRSFGPIPAALTVLLAIPFGRAADNDLARLLGIPVQPQLVAVSIGVLAAIWILVRRVMAGRPLGTLRNAGGMAALAFLAVGMLALLIGIAGSNQGRDVLRDARWWMLYATAPLALLLGVERRAVVRALLIGAGLFAVTVIAVAVLPVFPGGLKDRSLTYDYGSVRMIFGNNALLLPALGFGMVEFAKRASSRALWFVSLLTVAAVLSLTRSYLAIVAFVLLAALLSALWLERDRTLRSRLSRFGIGLGAVIASVAIGLSIVLLVANAVSVDLPPGATPEDPMKRIIFESGDSDLSAIQGGRFATYRAAADVIRQHPVTGSGLGTLVDVTYRYGGSHVSTAGKQPGVDNAYLTIGTKAGILGVAAFSALMLAPLWFVVRLNRDPTLTWFAIGWLGTLALTMVQSFATSGYAPFALGILLVIAWLPSRSSVGEDRTGEPDVIPL